MSHLSFPLPFTAALLAALLSATLWRDDATNPRAKTLFALFFASVGTLAALAGLRFGYQFREAGLLRAVLAMTPAPLSYLAFRALTAAEWPGWRVVLARHFWPVPVAALLLWLGRPPVDLAIVTSFLVYAALLARLRAQGPDVLVATSLGDSPGMLRMLTVVILLHVVSAATDLALFIGVVPAAPLLAGMNLLIIASMAWALLARPVYRAAGPDAPAAPPPEPPTDEDAALIAALEALLASQRLYCDPALTITRLARKLGVPARRVSQAVNRVRGLNVSQFVNNHRVAEAQRLLRETRRPVTDVMLEAGFQTKSNFNREFRRVTGESPSGWRQTHAAAADAGAA